MRYRKKNRKETNEKNGKINMYENNNVRKGGTYYNKYIYVWLHIYKLWSLSFLIYLFYFAEITTTVGNNF